MNNHALSMGPSITRPLKRNSHIQKTPINITNRSFRAKINLSSSQQVGFIHPSGSFDLGYILNHHNSNPQASEVFSDKKSHIRKISNSSSKHRGFSIDLSDISTYPNSSRKLRHSLSYKKVHNISNDDSLDDSPLAFNNEPEEDRVQLIVINIHTNWGSPDFLRISSISILDDKYMPLPVFQCITSPDYGIDTKCLFSGHLIKQKLNELFSIPWSADHEPVSLSIYVPACAIVSGVRIFNSNISLDSSVKDISLLFDNTSALQGEVPRNFGIDFKFTPQMMEEAVESSRLIDRFFYENERVKSFEDRYGQYPLLLTKTLYFELRKSWTSEKVVGLNGIQMFDQNNELLKIDDVDDILVQYGAYSGTPEILLKCDMKTSRPEQMFLMATAPEKCPVIEFIFKEKRFISRIVIWNYNSSCEPVEYGVKHMKICSDENTVWIGRIEKSVGTEMGANKKIKTIWMTDSLEFRNRINNH